MRVINGRKTQWSAILQPKLIGRALKAFSDMTVDDLSNFDKLKERILTTYGLCRDVYSTRFRTFVKRQQETYTDF